MPCNPLVDPKTGIVMGFVCSRGRREPCSVCKSRPHTKLCDFPLTGRKAGATCDRKLCDRCAARVGKNLDYCPAHAAREEKPNV